MTPAGADHRRSGIELTQSGQRELNPHRQHDEPHEACQRISREPTPTIFASHARHEQHKDPSDHARNRDGHQSGNWKTQPRVGGRNGNDAGDRSGTGREKD